MAQQKFRQRARIRRDVEHFVLADAGVGAGRHVAHGISASLARGDAGGGEAAHQAGRVVDVDVVKLKILARGDVRDAVGIFLGQLRHGFQLLGVQPAAGNLDALHAGRVPHRIGALGQRRPRDSAISWTFCAVVPLAVVVALAVGAPAQARFGEQALVDLALLAQRDFRFEDVDFARQLLRHFPGKLAAHCEFETFILALPQQRKTRPANFRSAGLGYGLICSYGLALSSTRRSGIGQQKPQPRQPVMWTENA